MKRPGNRSFFLIVTEYKYLLTNHTSYKKLDISARKDTNGILVVVGNLIQCIDDYIKGRYTMQKSNSSYLTYGAMMIALYAILLAIALYIPVLGTLISFVVPLPIAWYSAKFERRQGIMVTIVALVISFIIGAGLFGLLFGLLVAPLGFIMGDALRSKKSKLYMLMTTGIYLMFVTLFQYMISIVMLNINVIEEFFVGLEIYYEQISKTLATLGQETEWFDQMAVESMKIIQNIMPTYFIVGMIVTALVYLSINLPLLKKLKIQIPRFPKFREFQLPRAVLWYYLIVSIISLFVSVEIGTFGYMVLINASLLLRGLLFLQGVSLIHYYFHVQSWPKWGAVMATFLSLPLFTFTVILGVLDLGFNLRGYLQDRNKK